MTTNGKYNIIMADPAWAYRNVKTGGSLSSGAAQQYPVLTPAQVAALPVQHLIADDAVLLLWATTPLLPECLPVVPAWGFRYKTSIYWHKTGRLGMGYWFRGQVEPVFVGGRGRVLPELQESTLLRDLTVTMADEYDLVIDDEEVEPALIGVRGEVKPPRSVIRNWFAEAPTKHSRKPESFRKLVEDVFFPLFPEPRPLELFARHTAPGWTSLGLELGQDLRLGPVVDPPPPADAPPLPLEG